MSLDASPGCVVFDLDGTLVDSVSLITSLLNGMLADKGETAFLTEAEVRPRVTGGGSSTMETLLRGRCGDTASALLDFRARYAAARTPIDSVYPGARDALETLADAGFDLAVCSNKSQSLCEKVLGDVDLAGLFAAIVGTGPDAPLKPDPTIYEQAVSRSGGRVEASCLIGDSDVDLALARCAGVPIVFVTWGYGETADMSRTTFIADRFDQVPALATQALAGRILA